MAVNGVWVLTREGDLFLVQGVKIERDLVIHRNSLVLVLANGGAEIIFSEYGEGAPRFVSNYLKSLRDEIVQRITQAREGEPIDLRDRSLNVTGRRTSKG